MGALFCPIQQLEQRNELTLISTNRLFEDSIIIPETIVFADFCKNLKSDFKIVDFAHALGAYLDLNQKREDNKDIQQANALPSISLCKISKVEFDDSDIVNIRFLKKHNSRKKVKLHNVIIRLHSSKHVSHIITSRRNFRKDHPPKIFQHSATFPSVNATNRIIYIRPMLSESKYQLPELATEVITRLGYKFF